MTGPADIGAVVIGRNEGDRLIRCLTSLQGQVGRLIYVDSGSDDGSLDHARALGAEVIEMDVDQPFTAARARNAGLARLGQGKAPPEFVQFIDGDCEVQPGWIGASQAFLQDHPKAAVACGRRRERFPDASVYNRLIDQEWDTPIGQTHACGGDALMRLDAVRAVDGFNGALIAGEEPELCLRLRQAGWTIWRLDLEMTLHDAALSRFGQWWQRARRAGHTYAEGVALHGAPPERHCVAPLRRAVGWGIILPLITVLGGFITPWALLLLLAWPAQILRLRLRGNPMPRALFFTIGKLPEAQGVLGYWGQRIIGRRGGLIEYK